MYRLSTTTLAAAVALAVGGTAAAQQEQTQSSQHSYQSFQSSEHGRRADEEMRRLDRNQDQTIDESEAQASPELIAAWADVDLSRDGSVDATEYYLFAAQRQIAQLEGASGAGSQERSARTEQGSSQQQGGASRQGQAAEQGQQRSAGVQEPAAGQQQGGRYPSFEEVDTNSDGWVARTELAMLEGIDFSTADTNQDGFVSREEYVEATEQ